MHLSRSTLFSSAIITTVITLFVVIAPAMADDLEMKLKQYLGEDILSEPIQPPVMKEPTDYLPLREGRFIYELTNERGGEAGRIVETYQHMKKPSFGCHWVQNISDDYSNYLKFDDMHNICLMSHINHKKNRLTVFSPMELLIPDDFQKGRTQKRSLNVHVYKLPNTKNADYSGVLNQTVEYHGAYRIKLPAGSFDAILLVHRLKGQIGPASVNDFFAVFYAKNIGKVASLEHREISALLVYNKNSYVGKKLKGYQKP